MKSSAKFVDPHADQRRSEADKTARLRALRLAKEAADRDAVKEAADRKAAEQALRGPARRRTKQPAAATSAE